MNPKVSVHMITYNHERFIKQALDSVLMQNVNFEYEIVIGEDCSTDRTQEIVLQFQQTYPDRIRPLLREKNVGMNVNFIETLQACRGKYIALLEGDDYWTSRQKLQRQVDFLDCHPDCSSCFHTVQVVCDDGSKRPRLSPSKSEKEIFTVQDLLRSNFMKTCSVMFRSGLIGEFPEWFEQVKLLDWPLHILNAQHGDVGFINDVMAVYRIHPGAIWSKKDFVERIQESIDMLDRINAHFRYRYEKTIEGTVSAWHFVLALEYARKGNMIEAKKYARMCSADYRRRHKLPVVFLTVLWLIVSCPRPYGLFLSKFVWRLEESHVASHLWGRLLSTSAGNTF